MKITHIIPSIDNTGGGPPRSVTHLLTELGRQNPDVEYELHASITSDPILEKFHEENIKLFFHDQGLFGRLRKLESGVISDPPSIMHGQGIWELPIHQMSKISRKHQIPYVITPRGMLEPWSLSQKRLKKLIGLKLYQLNDLRRAACIHVTAQMEAESMRSLGLENPIAIIPNGVPIENFPLKSEIEPKRKKILFLSRIHLKKGLEFLIEAWSKLSLNQTRGWQIEIVGNGEQNYIKRLNRLIELRGLKGSIKILPPLYGSKKVRAYHDASLFVLPTHSENFGIVVAEALACGTPVITTKGAPWRDLELSESGWWIEKGVEPLINTLEIALSKSSGDLRAMGLNGRRLIEDKYSMETVGKKMHLLYRWLLEEIEKPDFVV